MLDSKRREFIALLGGTTTRFAMSGRAESSKTKFGEVAVPCPFTAGVSITKGY
jgi:hypothetical protein